MEPERKKIIYEILPAIIKAEKENENWQKVHNLMTEKQKNEFQLNGYTFMNNQQINYIYNKGLFN